MDIDHGRNLTIVTHRLGNTREYRFQDGVLGFEMSRLHYPIGACMPDVDLESHQVGLLEKLNSIHHVVFLEVYGDTISISKDPARPWDGEGDSNISKLVYEALAAYLGWPGADDVVFVHLAE